MRAPRATIVIPCYNSANTLGPTLDSVLEQSFEDFEIRIVDDGSTDDPAAVVAARGDARIHIERQAPSGGPSAPRNRAIASARSEVVFFCDADDLMRPGKLAAQMGVFDTRPDVGLVFTDFEVVDAEDRVVAPSFLAEFDSLHRLVDRGVSDGGGLDRRETVRTLLRCNFVGTSSVGVRRDVLLRAGDFDVDLASSEDFDLWLRIAALTDFYFLDRIGHAYRRHASSLMQERSARHPLARITVLERNRHLADDPATRRAVDRRIAANHAQVAWALEIAGEVGSARAHWWRALRGTPGLGPLKGLVRTSPGLSGFFAARRNGDG